MNWGAILIGMLVAIVLSFIPMLGFLLGPLVGGIIAGYMIKSDPGDAAVHGGIAAGLAGLFFGLILVLIINMLDDFMGIIDPSITEILGGISFVFALFIMVIYGVIGLIGGVVGGYISRDSKS